MATTPQKPKRKKRPRSYHHNSNSPEVKVFEAMQPPSCPAYMDQQTYRTMIALRQTMSAL